MYICLIFLLMHCLFILALLQPGIEGEAPYLTTDYSFELAGAGKLHVYKGLTRPGHTQFSSNAQWYFLRRIDLRFFYLSCLLTSNTKATVAVECTEQRVRFRIRRRNYWHQTSSPDQTFVKLALIDQPTHVTALGSCSSLFSMPLKHIFYGDIQYIQLQVVLYIMDNSYI